MSKVRIVLADSHAIVLECIRNVLQEMDAMVIVDEVGNRPTLLKTLA